MHHPDSGTANKESSQNSPLGNFKLGPNMVIEIPLKFETSSVCDDVSTHGSMEDESSRKPFTRISTKKSATSFIPRGSESGLIAQRFFSSESIEGPSLLAQKLDFDNVSSTPRKRIPSINSQDLNSPQLNKIISMTKIQKRFSEPLFDANEFFSLKSSTPQPTFETKLNESETKSSYSVPTDNLSESSFCNEVPLFFNFKDREHSTSFDFEPFESQKYEYSLPHEDLAGENWIKVISPETVKDLQEGKFNRPYLVIDCRYGYEYQGGHIDGAINLSTPDQIKRLFITNKHRLCKNSFLQAVKKDLNKALDELHFGLEESSEEDQPLPILIFHCEFSQKRGPRALRFLRKIDRQQNSFPNLTYPEIYLLKGGYESFNATFPNLCTNNGTYITMINPLYKKHFAIARTFEKDEWNFSNQLSMDFGNLSKSQGPVNNPNNYYFQ